MQLFSPFNGVVLSITINIIVIMIFINKYYKKESRKDLTMIIPIFYDTIHNTLILGLSFKLISLVINYLFKLDQDIINLLYILINSIVIFILIIIYFILILFNIRFIQLLFDNED